MDSVGALVRFEAKPDKVDEVEALLRALVVQVQSEESTIAWFGFRLGPTTFGVFHTFPTRQATTPISQWPARR
jgi:quinol monooxygenase YgiN